MSLYDNCYTEASNERDMYAEEASDLRSDLREHLTGFLVTLNEIIKLNSRGKTREITVRCQEEIEGITEALAHLNK